MIQAGKVDVHGTIVSWTREPFAPEETVIGLERFPRADGPSHVTWTGAVRTGQPPAPNSEPCGHFGSLRAFALDDGSLALVGPGTLATISPAGSRVFVSSSTTGTEGAVAGTVALHLMLLQRRLYHVHAGALTTGAGQGLLLCGGSGTGKTSTTLALLEAAPHLSWLSDDTVWLRPVEAGVLAHGYPAEFHVTAATLGRFASLLSHDVGAYSAQKRRIDPRFSHPTRERERCFVRMLVFPQVTSQSATRMTPMKQTESYATLLDSSALALLPSPNQAEHLETLATLARSTPSFALFLGRDALQDITLPGRIVLNSFPFT